MREEGDQTGDSELSRFECEKTAEILTRVLEANGPDAESALMNLEEADDLVNDCIRRQIWGPHLEVLHQRLTQAGGFFGDCRVTIEDHANGSQKASREDAPLAGEDPDTVLWPEEEQAQDLIEFIDATGPEYELRDEAIAEARALVIDCLMYGPWGPSLELLRERLDQPGGYFGDQIEGSDAHSHGEPIEHAKPESPARPAKTAKIEPERPLKARPVKRRMTAMEEIASDLRGIGRTFVAITGALGRGLRWLWKSWKCCWKALCYAWDRWPTASIFIFTFVLPAAVLIVLIALGIVVPEQKRGGGAPSFEEMSRQREADERDRAFRAKLLEENRANWDHWREKRYGN